MNQHEFEVCLLEMLVRQKEADELNTPCFEPMFAQFYDLFEHFRDKINKDDYDSLVNKMILNNLLSYDNHGYPKELKNCWTIEPTAKALNWLRELNRI